MGFEELLYFETERSWGKKRPLSCHVRVQQRDICESNCPSHQRLGLEGSFLPPKSNGILHFPQNSQGLCSISQEHVRSGG